MLAACVLLNQWPLEIIISLPWFPSAVRRIGRRIQLRQRPPERDPGIIFLRLPRHPDPRRMDLRQIRTQNWNSGRDRGPFHGSYSLTASCQVIALQWMWHQGYPSSFSLFQIRSQLPNCYPGHTGPGLRTGFPWLLRFCGNLDISGWKSHSHEPSILWNQVESIIS